MREKKPVESPVSFEQAFTRLKEVVSALEQPDVPLDRALALFEEGINLSRVCKERLDEAEGRVQQLLREADGRVVEAPFAPREDGR